VLTSSIINHSCPAVLLLVFNRPDKIRCVLERVRDAHPCALYIACDGPREGSEHDLQAIAEVRKIVESIDWAPEIFTLFRDANLGCGRAVSEGISWFFNYEEEGIILEDDCLPSPSFFTFCSQMLLRYRDNNKVACICGVNIDPTSTLTKDDYYFSRSFACWGWATWKRAWRMYHYDFRHYSQILSYSGARHHYCSLTEWLADCGNYYDLQRGYVNTWDWQWWVTCRLAGKVCCFPRVNLVRNIGFGKQSTHTRNPLDPMRNLDLGTMPAVLRHPDSISVNHKAEIRICYKTNKITMPRVLAYWLLRLTHTFNLVRSIYLFLVRLFAKFVLKGHE